jgi:hypothetical protein
MKCVPRGQPLTAGGTHKASLAYLLKGGLALPLSLIKVCGQNVMGRLLRALSQLLHKRL